jgi:hypothetical protein
MPVKNSRTGNGQPFSAFDFFTEMGMIYIIRGRRVNIGLSMLHMSSAKWSA